MPVIVGGWTKSEGRGGGSCVGGIVHAVVGWGVFFFLLGLSGAALVVRSFTEKKTEPYPPEGELFTRPVNRVQQSGR